MSLPPPAEQFDEWARTTVRHLPLYRRFCRGAALDVEVANRLLLSPVESQRLPNLLFAAVHDVLLSGLDDPLVDWYGSVLSTRGIDESDVRPIGEGAADPWPHFRRLALTDEAVADRLRTRSTQTNEIGRCAALVPALSQVAGDRPAASMEPAGLVLVELGASAGLNLLMDQYGYRYHRSKIAGLAPSSHEINPGAMVTLKSELRGDLAPPLPEELPRIVARAGLDLEPVSLSDADQARWLVACQWPDQPERVHRLRSAIALARGSQPRVIAADAVDGVRDLAARVASVAPGAHLVVYSTWALAYLEADRQAALLDVLDEISSERDLTLVFAEQPVLVPGLGVPARPDGSPDGAATALVRVDWTDGERAGPRRLADMHPHGTWLEWLETR